MIWLANALLLTVLIKQPTRVWPVIVAGGYAGNVLASYVAGRTPALAIALPACNSLEILLVAVPLRQLFSRDLDLSRLRHLGVFTILAGLGAPGLAAMLAAFLLRVEDHSSLINVWMTWYRADALGYLLLTPLLLMLRLDEFKSLFEPRKRWQTLGWGAALVVITAVVFGQNTYPLLFLPVALLGFIAVQLGAAGTATSIGFVAIAAVGATAVGRGPMMLIEGDLATRILVLQAFIAVTVLAKLPLNAILSDRKRLEHHARESNRQLQLAEQIAQIGHWSLAVPTREITWSEGVYRIHGLDPRTYTPTLDDGIDFYHVDDREKVAQWVQRRIEGTDEPDISMRLIRRDGAVRDVLLRGLCERDPAGAALVVFGTIIDVTELRQAERAVIESEARYRLIADHTTDMITQLDLDGGRVFVSPASRDLLGYEPEDLIGRGPSKMVHPDDQGDLNDLIAGFRAGQVSQARITNRLQHKDGRWIWVETSLKLLRNGEGKPSGFVAAVRNIVERKLANEALSQSEARYRLLADNATDLVVHGRDGQFLYISPAVKTLLGYTVEEAQALAVHEWVHADDLERVRATTRQLVVEQAASNLTYRLKHKSGHYIWVEVSFRRVHERHGGGVIAGVRDVTERVRQDQLLREAKSAAEAGARSKAEFLANMSHELRTPLTGMLGIHDLLQDDAALNERQRRLIDLAQDSGRALLAIVNDVLDFSKIEAGQMSIERVPFSCGDLVEACRQLGQDPQKRNRVALDVTIDENVPDLLLGDPTRVRQVLLNLVTNAIKFTPEGRVRIVVSWAYGRLRIEVTDTGIGVKPEVVPHLFERFRQADGSTARRFGGTGLGLSICKSLVELMGGSIGVESTFGKGSTFWFALPLVAVEPALGRKTPASPIVLQCRRILLAEDNVTNREIISAMLAQNGHVVTAVGDGFDAVDAARGKPFEVILMDVQMPGMDGLAATQAIRVWEAQTRQARTPIIAMTANAMIEEAQRCYDAGMDAHVAKPIAWAQLFAKIEQLCRSVDAVDVAQQVQPDRGSDTSSALPILDESTLAELAEFVGRDTIAMLLASFRRELTGRLSTLGEAGISDDQLIRHAHALMAMAGQLGFRELSEVCNAIHGRTQTGNSLDQIPTLQAIADRALQAAAESRYGKAA